MSEADPLLRLGKFLYAGPLVYSTTHNNITPSIDWQCLQSALVCFSRVVSIQSLVSYSLAPYDVCLWMSAFLRLKWLEASLSEHLSSSDLLGPCPLGGLNNA